MWIKIKDFDYVNLATAKDVKIILNYDRVKGRDFDTDAQSGTLDLMIVYTGVPTHTIVRLGERFDDLQNAAKIYENKLTALLQREVDLWDVRTT